MQKNIFLVVCGEFLEMNYTRILLTLIKNGKTILTGCLIIGLMGTIIQLPPKIFICISSFEVVIKVLFLCYCWEVTVEVELSKTICQSKVK